MAEEVNQLGKTAAQLQRASIQLKNFKVFILKLFSALILYDEVICPTCFLEVGCALMCNSEGGKVGGGPGHADFSPDHLCFGQGGLCFEYSNGMKAKDAGMKKQVL